MQLPLDQIQYKTYVLQSWTLIVYIFNTLAALTLLFVVYRQLRQVNKTMRANAFSAAFSELNELHRIFIQYPQLRPFFYVNKPLVDNLMFQALPQSA